MTQTPGNEGAPELRLQYAALSDVGRVRKDNQDSGYAGPWLLTVCDGVGGAARGDIASSTAVQQLRKLDRKPADDPLALVAGALHRAHDRIGELVDEEPSLNGTSTTATVALFDGRRVAIGHVGDTRAYLYRARELTQLTKDHTFVQSLIDEGRITEAESRVHPHRNLILKAVDGVHEAEPDLFFVELAPGDRLLLCSDGACGVLDDDRIADILSSGTVDYATVELVRASLEAGSSDNVTCIVAEVVEAGPDGVGTAGVGTAGVGTAGVGTAGVGTAGVGTAGVGTAGVGNADAPDMPLLVGAAADLPRRRAGGMASMFRGHRSGDTGELEPVPAEVTHGTPNDPMDPEVARYAPRAPRRFVWLKRFAAAAVVLGLVWMGASAAYAWTQRQYFVGAHDGKVTIFRGIDASLPGISLKEPYEESDIELAQLSRLDAETVREGIEAEDLADARRVVDDVASHADPACAEPDATDCG